MTAKLDGPYLQQLPAWSRGLEGWERLLTLAGVPPAEAFTLPALWDARNVSLAVDLFSDSPTAWFAFDRAEIGEPAGAVQAVYINTARLAGAAVSYAVKVTLGTTADHPGEYRSTHFQALDVRPAVADLQDYAEELADRHGLKVVINPDNVVEIDAIAPASLTVEG